MRAIPLLLLLCACGTLSTEERDRLAACQRNAALFFDGGRLAQAMGQIERGLELDPDDYKLNSMKGGILLLTSGDSQGTDHARLDEATALLADLYRQRSLARHEPYLLLNYGRALQKQGQRHHGESLRLDGQAARATADEAPALRQQAAVQRDRWRELAQKADGLFAELERRGELLRFAHYHRLLIARQLGDDAGFTAAAKAYLAQSEAAQQLTRQRIEQTPSAEFEAEQLQVLRRLRDEELEVRSLIAEYHYGRKEFEAALVQIDRVLEIDPQRSVDYYNRGRILLELQRADAAKADFRRFLATTTLPPTSEKTTFALQALDR